MRLAAPRSTTNRCRVFSFAPTEAGTDVLNQRFCRKLINIDQNFAGSQWQRKRTRETGDWLCHKLSIRLRCQSASNPSTPLKFCFQHTTVIIPFSLPQISELRFSTSMFSTTSKAQILSNSKALAISRTYIQHKSLPPIWCGFCSDSLCCSVIQFATLLFAIVGAGSAGEGSGSGSDIDISCCSALWICKTIVMSKRGPIKRNAIFSVSWYTKNIFSIPPHDTHVTDQKLLFQNASWQIVFMKEFLARTF